MRKRFTGALVALAIGLGAGAYAAPSEEESAVALRDRLARIDAQISSGNVAGAHDSLAAITRTKEFAASPPELRGRILALDAQVASQLGMTGYAAIAARSAAKLPGQEGLGAQVELLNAIHAQDDTAMRRALTTLATRYPATLNATPDMVIQIAAGRPTPDAKTEAAQATLAEALVANWRPQNPVQVLDYLRLALIRTRLADGRLEDARQATKGLEAPDIVITLRMDRRYDDLFKDGWSLPTPREMTEAQLAQFRARRPAWSRHGQGFHREARLLRALHADAEALQVIDAVLAEAQRSPKDFDDIDEALTNLHEQRGELLERLGRHDEAMAARRQAANTPQSGQPNVNQLLNFAIQLIDDDPKEALKLTSDASSRGLSPYGRLTTLYIQVCANQALGQGEQAQAAWRQILATRAPGANYQAADAALCLGDAEASAQAMIASLNRIDERPRMLRDMQVDLPDAQPLRTDRQRARMHLLRQVVFRPDVQAALAPHGRILKLTPEEVWRP